MFFIPTHNLWLEITKGTNKSDICIIKEDRYKTSGSVSCCSATVQRRLRRLQILVVNHHKINDKGVAWIIIPKALTTSPKLIDKKTATEKLEKKKKDKERSAEQRQNVIDLARNKNSSYQMAISNNNLCSYLPVTMQ